VKVLILTFGTRGVAHQLRARGHEPVLAAPQRFAGLAGEHGLSLAPVHDGPLRLVDRADAVGQTMTGGVRAKLAPARAMPAMFLRVFDDATAIATAGPGAGADVIVHNGQIIAAPHLAEKLAIPSVLADWPPTVVTTGYWFLPAAGQELPVELAAFLDAGEPPVFIGFGSMAGPDTAVTTEIVLAAVRKTGVRAVLGTGRSGLSTTEHERVAVVDQVPHDLLFQRVAAVVHHGGAGTTAAAAAAGLPQVICPFVADQPFWGRRMHRLGVGPPPIPQPRLTPDRLADAILTAFTDATIRSRAASLGALIRSERGAADAIKRLEALVSERAST
jgi:UDP:flavonoid glycosyltransferase YjiC (YdhE family)